MPVKGPGTGRSIVDMYLACAHARECTSKYPHAKKSLIKRTVSVIRGVFFKTCF